MSAGAGVEHKYDSNKMLELGHAFLNAGEACFREGSTLLPSPYQNVAGLVNYAFACELFMKCLLMTIVISSRGGSSIPQIAGLHEVLTLAISS